jgi:hypothetical protein
MKIVTTVTIKVNHPKCPFGVQQTYLQGLKSYSMQVKVETLYISNKGYPKVIKSREDCENI